MSEIGSCLSNGGRVLLVEADKSAQFYEKYASIRASRIVSELIKKGRKFTMTPTLKDIPGGDNIGMMCHLSDWNGIPEQTNQIFKNRLIAVHKRVGFVLYDPKSVEYKGVWLPEDGTFEDMCNFIREQGYSLEDFECSILANEPVSRLEEISEDGHSYTRLKLSIR